MIWFTSDLHFGHSAIIDFCQRPFANVDEMDRFLFKTWNNTIKPEDTVYCLGDMCFMQANRGVPLMRALNGKKILVQGNHDKWSLSQYESCGFIVVNQLMVKVRGVMVKMSHYPYFFDNTYDDRYLDRRPVDEGHLLLCGHAHKAFTMLHTDKGTPMINVGVDVWKFKPVSASQIEKLSVAMQRSKIEGAS